MLRLATDENFNRRIVRGLLKRQTDLDMVRMQDAGLAGADDPTVLAWAAGEGRILLTHDISTFAHHAYQRVRAGQPMPGVFEIANTLPIGRAVDAILLLAMASCDGDG